MHLINVVYITVAFAVMAMRANAASEHISASQTNDQYFTQDAYGQYSYGYNAPYSTKQEVRTIDGVTRGSYSYLDATGKWQTVQYIADADGFHVVGTNLPQNDLVAPEPVEETNEVAAARAQHLASHEQVKLRTSSLLKSHQPESSLSTYVSDKANLLPQPVQDTAEVAAAKSEFFKQYEEERQRHKLIREKQAARSFQSHAQFVSAAPVLPVLPA